MMALTLLVKITALIAALVNFSLASENAVENFSSTLKSCQIDEETITYGSCFINNQCYNDGDARKQGSIVSECQICNPIESQVIWSVKPGFSASIAAPPNDCSAIPVDTYQSCEVPSFEWASYSSRNTSRFYAMKGAISGNNLFAAGYLKSTIDLNTTEQTTQDFRVSGPYSNVDQMGNNATVVNVDLISYSANDGARENAGGSFGQYEVGIVKLDITTGEPRDVFLYGGHGLDETSGLAALGDMLAVSGHFTGNLTAQMTDGSFKTIINSNLMENGMPNPDDQFHPNQKDSAAESGSDDGFVIKANAETGKAEWIVNYPVSNKDSQIVGVDIDEDGNVYGSGYKCSQDINSEDPKVCDGVIVKFDTTSGEIVWEKIMSDIGAAFWIKYDASDGALYFTGTTTYGGSAKDAKANPLCVSESCAIVGRMSAETGEVEWVRSVSGSPRWGVFDQSGDIELASELDGAYIYVAFDNVGEKGPVTLDAGTSYAGCKDDSTGEITPEYLISMEESISPLNCPTGTTVVSRSDDSLPASSAQSGAHCGSRGKVDACMIKYHKYTGLPIWGVDLPPVAGIVPSPDGTSVMTAGWYYNDRWNAIFDSITLPGYLREGGLGSQKSGLYNAKLSTDDGKGIYVLHSGGGSKDRLYDVVGDSSGDIYNIGYSMNLVMNWGGTLATEMRESDVEKARTEAEETHFFVSKLRASNAATPTCLSSCINTTATAEVKQNFCFIDGVCYDSGATGVLFGKECFICDPTTSQTKWTVGAAIGTSHCFIDDVCIKDSDFLFSQRRTWSAKIFSACQVCDAAKDAYAWTILDEYSVTAENAPPNDCGLTTKAHNESTESLTQSGSSTATTTVTILLLFSMILFQI